MTGPRTLPSRSAVVIALVTLAPSIWFLHLAVSYALVPWSCRIGSDAPLHAVTVMALIGGTATAIAAWRLSRDGAGRGLLGRWMGGADGARLDGRATLALAAAAMAVYFVVVVMMTGLTPLLVDRCA